MDKRSSILETTSRANALAEIGERGRRSRSFIIVAVITGVFALVALAALVMFGTHTPANAVPVPSVSR